MRQVFADTAYWLALINPFDQYHEKAVRVSDSLGRARIITTDGVLAEYLNALADKGEAIRHAAIRSVEKILRDPSVTVVPQTHKGFLEGFGLYKSRPDKGYSLTDCISMTIMRRRKISQALTSDRHFVQEGFVALLRP